MAATFLTVGVAGTLVVHTAARRLSRTAAETRAASVLLGDLLEEMRFLTPDEVATTYPEDLSVDVGDTGLRDLRIVPEYHGFVAGSPNIQLSLTATWTTFQGAQRSITFDSAI